jgi:phosphoenolpyruvate-protein kinase (PTS system EI component)
MSDRASAVTVPFRTFIIKLHSRCNLACDYCYLYAGPDHTWRARVRAMSRAVLDRTARRIGEHAERHGLGDVHVVLHGGEPLLVGVDTLVDAATAVRGAVPACTRTDIRVQTNGTLLTEDVVATLLPHRIRVGVILVARDLAPADTAGLSPLDVPGPGRTADGFPVPLLANIGSVSDLRDPDAPRAEGVGLFRTELLYLDRADPPSVDEQIATYREVFAQVGRQRIVVRTLDSGADKPLAFLHHVPEPNPALGVRGLRLARRHPAVLRTQLEAIAAAAQQTDAEVWVMAPMVATADEAIQFVTQCGDVGLATAGVMIEVPAAALQAASILVAVDFLSIGTNDLSQYAFAADRECGELADLLDPWQPGLLRLISACGTAGAVAGKPVGVCGEAAAYTELAPVLVGLGMTTLSMSARAIPAVRESVARHTIAECRHLAQVALAAPDPAAARDGVARSDQCNCRGASNMDSCQVPWDPP